MSEKRGRALDGTEAIIPNESLITSIVINQSYSDRKVLIALPVQVGYASDLDLAMRLMIDVAQRHARVLREPAPGVLIKAFADSGIDLELAVWVEDPEQGKTNLRSDLYYGIWQEFRAHEIVIPGDRNLKPPFSLLRLYPRSGKRAIARCSVKIPLSR